MATAYKVLGQSNPSAATDTSLYVVPASTAAVCSTLTVCNQGVSTTVRAAIRPAGATISAEHYVLYEVALNQFDTATFTLGVTLATTDVVTVRAGTASVSFSLFGSELT